MTPLDPAIKVGDEVARRDRRATWGQAWVGSGPPTVWTVYTVQTISPARTVVTLRRADDRELVRLRGSEVASICTLTDEIRAEMARHRHRVEAYRLACETSRVLSLESTYDRLSTTTADDFVAALRAVLDAAKGGGQ